MIHIVKKITTILRSFYLNLKINQSLNLNGFRIGKGCILISPDRINIGYNVTIGERSILNCYKKSGSCSLKIGNNVQIGRDFQLNAYKSVEIGDGVLIADRVYISDATHIVKNPEISIIAQGTTYKGSVNIGKGTWIGVNACILPGVKIGENSIVGANSVVVNNVEKNSVVSGVPAVKIREN
tara:strand:+ start:177 stop:722 length:546 start_codon:yes stop_codon:yes gene_type:complete